MRMTIIGMTITGLALLVFGSVATAQTGGTESQKTRQIRRRLPVKLR